MTDLEKQIRKVIESFPDKENLMDLTLLVALKWSGGDEQQFPLYVDDEIEVMAGAWMSLSTFMYEYSNPKIIGVIAGYEVIKRLEDV